MKIKNINRHYEQELRVLIKVLIDYSLQEEVK